VVIAGPVGLTLAIDLAQPKTWPGSSPGSCRAAGPALLANHIGDQAALLQALQLARGSAPPQI